MESGGRTIVVAVDNSEACERALEWTLQNMYKNGEDELWLLHVIPVPLPEGIPLVLDMAMPVFPQEPDPSEDQKHIHQAVAFICSRFGSRLNELQIPYKIQVSHCASSDLDSVGQAICKRAEALHADALVMTKHQRGVLKEFFLGSVCKYCCLHSKAPLVVLHV